MRDYISNTSCLILLNKINRLDLLEKMYGRVLITETVKDEFGEDVPEFNEIRSLKNPSTFLAHRQFIDPGEASTISLGIIMKAKERGFVTSVRGYLEDLQKNGMWISEELIHELLDLSGEVKGA